MARYGFVLDLPLPIFSVGAGDLDPVDFTLTSQGVPINLTGKEVELRLEPLRGTRTPQIYRTDAASPQLTVTNAAGGIVTLSPNNDLTVWLASADQYRGYFLIGPTPGRGQRVPQDTDIFIDVRPVIED